MNGPRTKSKVLVAMSGGVDSSVAALLLQQQGYDVIGCFMRLGTVDGVERVDADAPACDTHATEARHHGCCTVEDAQDARMVAALLGIPFYVMNFRQDFGRIIDHFVDEYNAGRTPNPCIRCNNWLKFGKLHRYARSIDCDFIASGHYARIVHNAGVPRLLRGLDRGKDQSYVLFGSPRDRLDHMLLPVGEHTKDQIREIASEHSLPVFDKPDSQEICFVPDNDYAGLVTRQTPQKVASGDVVDTSGAVVGQHGGQQRFTIGQRRGLGMALGYPVYVVDRNAQHNTVTIGTADDLLADGLIADETNWLIDPPTDVPRPCTAMIRYNGGPVEATVLATGSDTLRIEFLEPVRAVSPGQAVVCYDDDRVLGGGWIVEAGRTEL
ncbi:MAG: tRNA 2-thiouridine(34) synthase MnmA [Phycisphaeraceae bacterium]|jgi:tRNA-specific 2-thiouridylase|nr:tRNA 2-thiouridine(34) synthase MnmA [Phycisphaeraceae bacterium]